MSAGDVHEDEADELAIFMTDGLRAGLVIDIGQAISASTFSHVMPSAIISGGLSFTTVPIGINSLPRFRNGWIVTSMTTRVAMRGSQWKRSRKWTNRW